MKIVLQQKQTLNLVMTTELRQAIELLQLSTYELSQFIQQQELENPFIELVEKEQDSDFNKRNYERRGSATTENPVDFIASNKEGMCEKLVEQIQWLPIDQTERSIIEYLVFNLDGNGYLSFTADIISEDLGADVEIVEKAIEKLQSLEPIGVGARNLKECLLIQIRKLYPEDYKVASVIENHLENLANKKWHTIANQLEMTIEEVNRAFEVIQTLNPRPCASLANDRIDYVTPDIVVEVEEDDFVVRLNDYYIPNIRFNKLQANNPSKEVATYAQESYRNFQWLQNSIEQRRQTIIKIMQVIVERQEMFFKKGFSALQPLTLKEVAEEIDMHESTVSRATANKMIQTPKGTFDLRLLFSSKLGSDSGDDLSQTKVKMLLEKFVEEENKLKPLSDQKIADQFKVEGIKISRRTIAKYRDELNIPSSSRRKEFVI